MDDWQSRWVLVPDKHSNSESVQRDGGIQIVRPSMVNLSGGRKIRGF